MSCFRGSIRSAIGSSSMTTQMEKGMTLEEAKILTRGEVAEALD